MISDATLRRYLAPSTVALTGDLVRALLWGAVAVVWLSFLQVYVRMWRLTLVDPAHSDFTIFYYTARLVADGLPMYGASPARYGIEWSGTHLGNLNPPHFQLLVQPLAALSYGQAFVAWTSASLVALAVSVGIIANGLGVTLTARRVAIWGAFVVSCAGFTTVAITSEMTFLLMVPFSLALLEARRGRWGRAGAWLGLCASLKLFLLLFIPWLAWRKRWRALAGAGGAMLAVVAAGTLAYGPSVYAQWVGSLGEVGWEWFHMNASWPGLVSRVARGGEDMARVWDASGWVEPVSLVGAVAICAISLFALSSWRDDARETDLAFLTLVTGAILASPLGWVYYLPLALGPLAGCLLEGSWRRLPTAVLIPVAVLSLYLYVPPEQAASGQPSRLATLLLASSYFWGTSALWLGAALAARRVAP
jgi:hypothetical protein